MQHLKVFVSKYDGLAVTLFKNGESEREMEEEGERDRENSLNPQRCEVYLSHCVGGGVYTVCVCKGSANIGIFLKCKCSAVLLG